MGFARAAPSGRRQYAVTGMAPSPLLKDTVVVFNQPCSPQCGGQGLSGGQSLWKRASWLQVANPRPFCFSGCYFKMGSCIVAQVALEFNAILLSRIRSICYHTQLLLFFPPTSCKTALVPHRPPTLQRDWRFRKCVSSGLPRLLEWIYP